MTGQIPFYEDLISGLFMYASTHAVALFSCFVLLIDLNSIRDRNEGSCRSPSFVARRRFLLAHLVLPP